MKVYLDVAAIRGRRSTQGSNLFQLSERAGVGGTEMRPAVFARVRWAGWRITASFGQGRVWSENTTWLPPKVRSSTGLASFSGLRFKCNRLLSAFFLRRCVTFNATFGSGNKYAETDRSAGGGSHDSRDRLPHISYQATALRP